MLKKSLFLAMAIVATAGVCMAKGRVTPSIDAVDKTIPISSSIETTVKAGELITIVATVDGAIPGFATAIMLDSKDLKFVGTKKGEVLQHKKGPAPISVVTARDRAIIRVLSKEQGISDGDIMYITFKALRDSKTKLDFINMKAAQPMEVEASQKISFNLM